MTREARFWEKVDRSGECWLWTADKTARGYGRFMYDGKVRRAHRLVWEWAHGPIPAAMVVRHTCDNPSCVRLEHLVLGTQGDNVADMVAKGRSCHSERAPRSKLTVAAVRDIRSGGALKDFAAKYGVSVRSVRAVVYGEAWRHVD